MFQVKQEDIESHPSSLGRDGEELMDGEREGEDSESPYGDHHDKSDSDNNGEEGDLGGDEGRRSLKSVDSEPRCVLQFSLAKVLAHKAATRLKAKKAAKGRTRLGVPSPDMTPNLNFAPSDAALEVRFEHEDLEEDAEVKPKKKHHWPKILVSLWPKGKGKKADFIPLDIRREGEEMDDEDDADSAERHSEEGGSVDGENESDQDGHDSRSESEAYQGSDRESRSRSGSVNHRRSTCDSQHSAIVKRDSIVDSRTHHDRENDSVTFMNLVCDFMEESLIKSYRKSRVRGRNYVDVTTELETQQRFRLKHARERALRAVEVKAEAVQCDDMWENLTDEEMIARMVTRNVIKKAIFLEKELVHQEAMDIAAKAVAEEILTQIEESVEHISPENTKHKNQRKFSICLESPVMENTKPSDVKLRVEYSLGEESEPKNETETSASLKELRVSELDKTASQTVTALKLRPLEPLPPIGSQKFAEDIGLINPATSCDSKIICKCCLYTRVVNYFYGARPVDD